MFSASVQHADGPVTRRYRIKGVVQGVGFRPFVHRLAKRFNVTGWVLNDSEGVLLQIQGPPAALAQVMQHLAQHPPPLARVRQVVEQPVPDPLLRHDGFEIHSSVNHHDTNTIIPPDSDVCNDCRRELLDPRDRRYRYPFINCTNCGPRYSIIHDMPYDRAQTTMRAFALCPPCRQEYDDIDNRRYHAQPNACPDCGPTLQLADRAGRPIPCDDVVNEAIARLRDGRILAIKSLGGFHLAIDAQRESAVRELRARKRRDSKPFALMVRDVEAARRYALVGPFEQGLLTSPARPIVLLRKRPGALGDAVAPRNPNFGIMLPSAPLHELLVAEGALPVLVMTSGNISGHPIVYDNETALEQLSHVADDFLWHDRDIRTRVDDSIVRASQDDALPRPLVTFIRRSRGYAPYPVHVETALPPIVAVGAELKTTVALSKGSDVVISQHIGDLKHDSTYQAHADGIAHIQKLLSVSPIRVAADMHPGFRSTREAARRLGLPVTLVQHHHAHMASCMAENGLEGPVIGAIFDGTGYGLDGGIWGGEFLVGDYCRFARRAHLRPFYLLGGDRAVQEPVRVGVSLLVETFGALPQQRRLPIFEALDPFAAGVFEKMALRRVQSALTTSMGRLFDGVSSLIGLCHKIEYEAQAAIELEGLLERDFTPAPPFAYAIEAKGDVLEIDYRPLIRELVAEVSGPGRDAAFLSRRFHSTIVDVIVAVCVRLAERHGLQRVALSGGVFMNEFILVRAVVGLRGAGLTPYVQEMVPPNDGGISLGQLMVAHARSQAEARAECGEEATRERER